VERWSGGAVHLFLFLPDLLKCDFFIYALVIHFIYCIFNDIVFLFSRARFEDIYFYGELFEMHLNGNTFKQYFNFGMATINGFMTGNWHNKY